MTTDDDRDETRAERADRNLMELLQELRVAGLGVQVLFGFLLAIPFSNRFARISDPQRALYVADLFFAALSTALLLTPVAYHRMVFRRHLKEPLVRVANVMAIAGLVTVGLSIVGAVLLVISFVAGGGIGLVLAALIAFVFVVLWFAIPLIRRQRARMNHKRNTRNLN
ncbi:MAG TPA: DUF6328 family protein [Streptosporangiaceae bacterium]